jgi:alpha-mannosidase
MCRPGGREDKPPVFWWQAPDGSRVLVNLEQTWYNDHIGPHNTAAMLAFCEKTGLRDWLNVYGVGDHGGGPTRRDIRRAHDMDAWPIYPRFKLATTRRYFKILERLADELPVLDQELNYEFTGCYTSQSRIKLANRLGENYGIEAETAAALAWRAAGQAYPHELLREAWIGTLFGHFHDILPGSGVQATREYQLGLFQESAAAAQVVKTNAYRALAARVDTSCADGDEKKGTVPLFGTVPSFSSVPPEAESVAFGGGAGRGSMWGGLSVAGHVADGPRPFVVFNPTAWDRTELVQVTVWDAHTGQAPGDLHAKEFVVLAAGAEPIPAQKIGVGDYWGHKYVDLVFPASVGSLGYATLVVDEGTVEGFEPACRCGSGFRGGERQPVGATTLENEQLFVEFDRASGGVVKLVVKATGLDLADPADPLGLLEYLVERPRGMTSWILGDPKRRICPLELTSLEPGHAGPHLVSMVARARVDDSEITVTYSLTAGRGALDIKVKANWLQRGTRDQGTPTLRMQIPAAITGAKARYEIPYGAIDRDLAGGEEVPALRWADVTGKQGRSAAGLTLLNDSKYGHSLDGSTLRLTLIRSSSDPDPLPEMGEHAIRMAVVPHGPRPATAELIRLGAAFNHPLMPVATDVHDGTLPPDGAAAVTCGPDRVLVSAVKKAEDDAALIVRLFETAGKKAQARVVLAEGLLGPVADAVEVDLLERPLEESTARKTEDGFTVALGPNAIATVKVTFS